MRRSGGDLARIGAVAGALVVVAAAVWALTRGTGSYEIRAQFLDAGQLVKGNVAQVAGRRVGTVTRLDVTDDGRAEATIRIDDDRLTPLHRGTTMAIRTYGLAGVANRFVEITPGSRRAPSLEDGAVLGTDATTGIVDIDAVLDAFGPQTRGDLRELIAAGARGVDGTAAASNRFLRYLAPATAQTRALLEDVGRDQAAVDTLVTSASRVAGALAHRRADVTAGIDGAGRALTAVAQERRALGSAVQRAPGVLTRAQQTLRATRATLHAVRPALRETRPAGRPLARVLRQVVPVAAAARPQLAAVTALLPALGRTLRQAPGLADTAVPALQSANSAIAGGAPIYEGLRAYALDAVRGLIAAGNVSGYYDGNGQHLRIVGNMDPGGSSNAGAFSLFPSVSLPLSGDFTDATARCPGSVGGPLTDGSDRVPVAPGVCDPKDGR